MNFGDGFYALFKPAIRAYFKNSFNIEEEVNEVKDFRGAYLMVGQHIAIEDSLIAIAYSNKLIRFLAAEGNMDIPWKNIVFKTFNVIPFARQRLDVKAIRKLKETVDEGQSIGLFPEGARSWDGCERPLIASTAKLIKMLKVPVYNITFNGLYLSRPRWAETNGRKGKVAINIRRIFSKEEIQSASLPEVLEKMESAIAFNEFEWQKKAMVPFKGKNLAEYIERLLYRCPACDAVNSLSSKGNDFTCDHCGAVYTVNTYGLIEGSERFDNTADWNAWQKKRIPELLETEYTFTNPSIALLRAIGQERISDTVDMTLTNRDITIVYPDKNREVIPLSETRGCDALFSNLVEFWHGNIKYQFCFDPEKSHMSVKLFEDFILAHIEAIKHTSNLKEE